MIRYRFVLLAFCATLMGCAVAQAQERRPIAWDGLGQDPNKHPNKHPNHAPQRSSVTKQSAANPTPAPDDPNQERERVLGTLRPYSEAWWAVRDEIEAENDRQLGTKLMICPRCVQSPPGEDVIGSVR